MLMSTPTNPTKEVNLKMTTGSSTPPAQPKTPSSSLVSTIGIAKKSPIIRFITTRDVVESGMASAMEEESNNVIGTVSTEVSSTGQRLKRRKKNQIGDGDGASVSRKSERARKAVNIDDAKVRPGKRIKTVEVAAAAVAEEDSMEINKSHRRSSPRKSVHKTDSEVGTATTIRIRLKNPTETVENEVIGDEGKKAKPVGVNLVDSKKNSKDDKRPKRRSVMKSFLEEEEEVQSLPPTQPTTNKSSKKSKAAATSEVKTVDNGGSSKSPVKKVRRKSTGKEGIVDEAIAGNKKKVSETKGSKKLNKNTTTVTESPNIKKTMLEKEQIPVLDQIWQRLMEYDKNGNGDEEYKHVFKEPTLKDSIVNDEICSCCGETGSLICCEGCPKSFHFYCTVPIIDPGNIPDEPWFCSACREGPFVPPTNKIKTLKGLLNLLNARVRTMNPKASNLHKKLKKVAEKAMNKVKDKSRESMLKVMNETVKDMLEKSKSKKSPLILSITRPDPNIASTVVAEKSPPPPPKDALMSDDIVEHIPETHTPSVHRQRVTEDGYCQKCSKKAIVPSKMLIQCDGCTLLWHLDCLPYPLAVYPSSNRQWLCPVHLSADNLNEVFTNDKAMYIADKAYNLKVEVTDWPESSSITVSEEAIRARFASHVDDNRFNMPYKLCAVPEAVMAEYQSMRSISLPELNMIKYYASRSYVDQSVEAFE